MTTCGMYDSAGEWVDLASGCRPRAASPAASSPCCRASSASASSRRGWTRAATACAASRSAASCRATRAALPARRRAPRAAPCARTLRASPSVPRAAPALGARARSVLERRRRGAARLRAAGRSRLRGRPSASSARSSTAATSSTPRSSTSREVTDARRRRPPGCSLDCAARLAAEDEGARVRRAGAHDALLARGRRGRGSSPSSTRRRSGARSACSPRDGGAAAPPGGVELARARAVPRPRRDEQVDRARAAALEPAPRSPGDTIFAGGRAGGRALPPDGRRGERDDPRPTTAARGGWRRCSRAWSSARRPSLGRARRTADVTAETRRAACVTSPPRRSRASADADPALQAALLHNLLRGAYETIDRLTREVATLSRGR